MQSPTIAYAFCCEPQGYGLGFGGVGLAECRFVQLCRALNAQRFRKLLIFKCCGFLVKGFFVA